MEPVLGGSQPVVDGGLKTVVTCALNAIQHEFHQLLQQPLPNDSDRKRGLLQALHTSRQLLLRLHTLTSTHPMRWKIILEGVGQGKVLDTIAGHVRTLSAVTSELGGSQGALLPCYSPMFDVQTAMEVLSTGSFQALPSAIQVKAVTEGSRPQLRLRYVTHLLHKTLLQASLPSGLHVVSVRNGSVLLRAEGMYEAQLTLVPALPPPGIPANIAAATTAGGATAAAAAAAAASAAPHHSEGASGSSAQQQQQQQQPSTAAGARQRWRWRLLAFSLVGGTPLQASQHDQLLHNLNIRMDLAADAAVYAQHDLLPSPGGAPPPPAHAKQDSAMPSASGLSGVSGQVPAASLATSAATASAQNCARSMLGLLQKHVADETTSPLVSLHVILADIAGKLGVDETTGVVKSLLLPGRRWAGHVSLQPSALLLPGVRVSFWRQALPLMDLDSGAGLTSNAAAMTRQGTGSDPQAPSLPTQGAGEVKVVGYKAAASGAPMFQPPFVEIGCGADGLIEVLLQATASGGGGAPPPAPQRAVLSLGGPPTPASLDALLLRAGCAAAGGVLRALERRLQAATPRVQGCTFRLTSVLHSLRVGGAGGETAHGTHTANCSDCDRPLHKGEGRKGDPEQGGRMSGQQQVLIDGDDVAPCSSCAEEEGAGGLSGAAAAAERVSGAAEGERVTAFPSSKVGRGGGTGRGGGGSGSSSGSSSSSALVALDAPVLEVRLRGLLLLRLGCDLVSGRLVVLPGSQEGATVHLETFAASAVEEDKLHLLAWRAVNAPSEAMPVRRALDAVAAELQRCISSQALNQEMSAFFVAAPRASLHHCSGMKDMFAHYAAAHGIRWGPGCDGGAAPLPGTVARATA
ncbi:MAG: hypothetical protein WDW36_004818 [Sanguina aurantia]